MMVLVADFIVFTSLRPLLDSANGGLNSGILQYLHHVFDHFWTVPNVVLITTFYYIYIISLRPLLDCAKGGLNNKILLYLHHVFKTTFGQCQRWSCLFVLRFYGPVNPMGSCQARSIYLTTRLLGRLSPLSG